MGLPAVTHYLVRWRGHTSADDEWLREEELVHCWRGMMPPPPVVVRVGETPRRCRPPPRRRRRHRRGGRQPLPRRHRWSLLPASGCRLSRRGGDGPRLSGQDGAVLLARRWLGSWDGGSGTALGRRWVPRWSTRCSMPPRTGRPAAGSCCARRASRPVA